MPISDVLGGFISGTGEVLQAQRKQIREAEDRELKQQQELIHSLIKSPDVNPAMLGRLLEDYVQLGRGRAQTRKAKPGAAGFFGETETPMSQIVRAMASGEIPVEGPTTETITRALPSVEWAGSIIPPPPAPPLPEAPGRAPLAKAAAETQAAAQAPTATVVGRRREAVVERRPAARQPLFVSREELGEREARVGARGAQIGRETAISDIEEAPYLTPEERREAIVRQFGAVPRERGGTTAQTYEWTDEAGNVQRAMGTMVDGVLRHAVTGEVLPTTALQVREPTSRLTPDQLGIETRLAAEAAKLNKSPDQLTPAERDRIITAYQTEDANRRRAVTQIIGQSGMTAREVAVFQNITARAQRSPLLQAADRLVTLRGAIQRTKQSPSNGPTQLALMYAFIQALDTYQSAVREGELALNQALMSRIGTVQANLQRIAQGIIVDARTANAIADEATALVADIESGVTIKERQFESEANVTGVGNAWREYRSAAPVLPSAPGRSATDYRRR